MNPLKLICPKYEKTYVFPTKKWLKPLKELILDDVNTVGRLIISELINTNNNTLNNVNQDIIKGKIIVKITKGRNTFIKRVNELIKNLPNTVYTYCVILCYDDFLLIDKNKSYCNIKAIKEEYAVTLELMKYYKYGFLSSKNKLNIDNIKSIIKQLIYCQINIFSKYGLTHNDIHKGNILINKINSNLEYKYINKKIDNQKYEFILSDYDKMFEFNITNIRDHFNLKINESDENNYYTKFSLYNNIINIFYTIIKLSTNKNDLLNKLNTFQNNYENEIHNKIGLSLKDFLKNANQNKFLLYNTKLNMIIFNKIYKLLFY